MLMLVVPERWERNNLLQIYKAVCILGHNKQNKNNCIDILDSNQNKFYLINYFINFILSHHHIMLKDDHIFLKVKD
jgi:hypothetical protein